MAQKIRLQVLRVNSSNRLSITPYQGEFLWETDTKNLFVGDGSTAGGNLVETAGGSIVSSVNGATGIVVVNADDIPFTPNGDISSTNTQDAIVEVRDETDTKLSSKEDSSNKGVANGYAPLNSDSQVPLANLPIYNEYQEDLSTAVTTSNSYSVAHSYTTGVLPAGDYIIHNSLAIEPNATNNDYLFQWRVNGVDEGFEFAEEGKDTSGGQRNIRSSFFKVTLTAGSHTVDVRFRRESSGTLVLHGSKIHIQRIA